MALAAETVWGCIVVGAPGQAILGGAQAWPAPSVRAVRDPALP